MQFTFLHRILYHLCSKKVCFPLPFNANPSKIFQKNWANCFCWVLFTIGILFRENFDLQSYTLVLRSFTTKILVSAQLWHIFLPTHLREIGKCPTMVQMTVHGQGFSRMKHVGYKWLIITQSINCVKFPVFDM